VEFTCEALRVEHDTTRFDSSQPTLDHWLQNSARDSDGRNLTRTFIWHRGDNHVVAYFTLMPYFIERQTLTKGQGRGLPDRIPCFLLARLALHRDLQGQRLGSQLLASALTRAATAARLTGGRYIVVDAIDDTAAAFYQHHGFTPIGDRADRLVLPTKALEPYLPETDTAPNQ